MKVIEKLSTYAALIGVIGAIGGGFMAWGEFNNRIAQLEDKEFIVNEKHKVVEDIIASSVASGEASFNKKQIVDILVKSKFSKQEVEASLQLLEDMDVAFQPFRSAKLDRQYRMNAAKIAYSISIEEIIFFY